MISRIIEYRSVSRYRAGNVCGVFLMLWPGEPSKPEAGSSFQLDYQNRYNMKIDVKKYFSS